MPPADESRAEAEPSRREDQPSKFTLSLRAGVREGVPGIISTFDRNGDELRPYDHQRKTCMRIKKATMGKSDPPPSPHEQPQRAFVIAHDAGLGKTATSFIYFASLELLRQGNQTLVVSAPVSTLRQWEDTLLDWLKRDEQTGEPLLPYLCTNHLADVTAHRLATIRILIVSRDLVARAFRESFEKVPKDEKETRNSPVKYRRKVSPHTGMELPLSPLLEPSTTPKEPRYSLLVVDEVHFMRNASSERCFAHAELAKLCGTRIGLTGTPILNSPGDMVGLCKSLHAPAYYREKRSWVLPNQRGGTRDRLNAATARMWKEGFTDRKTEACLNLPPIRQEVVPFEPQLDAAHHPGAARRYNEVVKEIRQMQFRGNSAKAKRDRKRYLPALKDLQFLLVSPLLCAFGAKDFDDNPAYYKYAAAAHETGSTRALRATLDALFAQGHQRVIVAASHVSIMRVARLVLEASERTARGEGSEGGAGSSAEPRQAPTRYLMYDGSLSRNARQDVKTQFLDPAHTGRAVLFLSILSGGTGLHLVPGCNAIVFWGTLPFAPGIVWQALKRIHRIGQEHPVDVRHVVSEGSVDAAIGLMHQDKDRLAEAVVEYGEVLPDGTEEFDWKFVKIREHLGTLDCESGNFEGGDGGRSGGRGHLPAAAASASAEDDADELMVWSATHIAELSGPAGAIGREVAIPSAIQRNPSGNPRERKRRKQRQIQVSESEESD